MAIKRRSDKTADALTVLKRHLRSCGTCQAGIKARDLSYMCDAGSWHVIAAARQYDDIIRLRVNAHRNDSSVVYACPDLSAHGMAYAITATPCHVTAVQDSLF